MKKCWGLWASLVLAGAAVGWYLAEGRETGMRPLVLMECFLIVLVFVGLPLYAACMRKAIRASARSLTAAEYDKLPEQLQGRYIEVQTNGETSYVPDPGASAGAGLRAFNLPRGSIRGMLALLAVGSFVIVLTLGGETNETTTTNQDGSTTTVTHRVIGPFEQVVTAFGTLTGAIIGFYFGGRSSGSNPDTR